MKILISAYTGLGNFVLKTPMIHRLKELYPSAQIDLIAGNGFGTEYVLKGAALIGQTHILKTDATWREKMRFFWHLRKEHYDLLLLPFDACRSFLNMGSYIAGIKQRIRHIDVYGHGTKPRLTLLRRFLMYPRTIYIPILPSRHEIDLNYDLIEAFYDAPFERKYETKVSFQKSDAILQKFDLQPNEYIVLQTGVANGQFNVKAWGVANFIQLINNLLKKYEGKIVLVGDKGDYETAVKFIVEKFEHQPKVINTAGQTSINDLVNLLHHAQLTVCHDSGVMHLADALAKPLIALYGPTDYTRTRPLKPTSRILFSKTPHFAAMYNFKTTEAKLVAQGLGHTPMQGIGVEDVMSAILKIL